LVVHIGTNNFCKLKGFGPQHLININTIPFGPPQYERPPDSYQWDPDEMTTQVKNKIEELVLCAGCLLPDTKIVTTDPTARRTKGGFANSRARSFSRLIEKQSPLHHHLITIKRYLRNNKRNHKNEDGGRYPLKEQHFNNDGVHYSKPELSRFLETLRKATKELDEGKWEAGTTLSPNYFYFKF
jgi:hypothetical protein